VLDRQARLTDARRPDAVARRRKTNQRTARENIDDLCDPGTFTEYGGLVIAGRRRRNTGRAADRHHPRRRPDHGHGQRQRRPLPRGPRPHRRAVLRLHVLAGTQGARNHEKMDRMLELAHRWRLPLVFFTEGGGGRPGRHRARRLHPRLRVHGPAQRATRPWSGSAPAAASPATPPSSAAATWSSPARDSTIGMGGPAMVEGGGLGVFRPEEIGPIDVQQRNGVIDVLVEDEAAAVRRGQACYLSYSRARSPTGSAPTSDPAPLVSPESACVCVYDVRRVIADLADETQRGLGAAALKCRPWP
jgi:acetyl-CoA carboxylase carboxyltransferase component